MRKSQEPITKQSKTELNTIYINKQLRIQLYHQEILVDKNFRQVKMFHQKRIIFTIR